MSQSYLLAIPTSKLLKGGTNERFQLRLIVTGSSARPRFTLWNQQTGADIKGRCDFFESVTIITFVRRFPLWDPLADSLRLLNKSSNVCGVCVSLRLCLLPQLSLSPQSSALCSVPSWKFLFCGAGRGQDRPCWADLIPPGLTMDELCCYINIYS